MRRPVCVSAARALLVLVFCGGIPLAEAAPAGKGAGDEHFGIPQVKFINEQIASVWADAGLQPSAPAADC